jgi:hypothetical protein
MKMFLRLKKTVQKRKVGIVISADTPVAFMRVSPMRNVFQYYASATARNTLNAFTRHTRPANARYVTGVGTTDRQNFICPKRQ